MTSRAVVDPRGVEWFVLEVRPSEGDLLRESRAGGWLVARSEKEVRRIRPIPDRWFGLSDLELLALIKRAPMDSPAPRLVE